MMKKSVVRCRDPDPPLIRHLIQYPNVRSLEQEEVQEMLGRVLSVWVSLLELQLSVHRGMDEPFRLEHGQGVRKSDEIM